jgi:hypothetical protein
MTVKLKPGLTNNKVFYQIENMPTTIKKAISGALYEIGGENVTHAKYMIFRRKTGRIYVIKGAFHQASAPYEPPANLSGDLARNLGYTVRGSSQMEFGDKAQPGKEPYGKYLEGGTIKMKPRSHIGATVKARFKNAENSFISYTKRELKI